MTIAWSPREILEREGRPIVPGSVTSHRLPREPSTAALIIREIRARVWGLAR